MGRLPALPILYWGLPVLAFGLGATMLLASGLQLGCQCGPLGVPMFLGALYFTAFGLVALVARWRNATGLADAALFAIGLALAIGLLADQVAKLLTIRQPPTMLSGQLASLSVAMPYRHSSGANATLVLSDGRRLTWRCGEFDCHGRDDALRGLRQDLPVNAQILAAGSQVLGLTANGVQILDPEVQRPRLFGARVLSVAGSSLVLAVLALIGYFRWRKTQPTYRRPPPVVLPTLRRPRP